MALAQGTVGLGASIAVSDRLLEITGLSKRFRGLVAVSNVSFSVPYQSIVSLIGPNGAGKTTTFNLITGMITPDAGRVMLEDQNITHLRPDLICKAGIGRTFQLVRPFAGLSVLDNVTVGALRPTADVHAARRSSFDILELLGLADKAHRMARTLTLAERKKLEVARALATKPKLLLLDEVMAGLRPTEVDAMVGIFAALPRQTGVSILLTEHVMRAVMALAQHIVVLHHGVKICEGSPQAVARDPLVLESYLGPMSATNGAQGDAARR
jgi:branched-chain amino acid transport system ATP-binding protein